MTLSAAMFLPSCLLRNLSWLSYFSALGVLSSMCLLFGVLATGLLQVLKTKKIKEKRLCGLLFGVLASGLLQVLVLLYYWFTTAVVRLLLLSSRRAVADVAPLVLTYADVC